MHVSHGHASANDTVLVSNATFPVHCACLQNHIYPESIIPPEYFLDCGSLQMLVGLHVIFLDCLTSFIWQFSLQGVVEYHSLQSVIHLYACLPDLLVLWEFVCLFLRHFVAFFGLTKNRILQYFIIGYLYYYSNKVDVAIIT